MKKIYFLKNRNRLGRKSFKRQSGESNIIGVGVGEVIKQRKRHFLQKRNILETKKLIQ